MKQSKKMSLIEQVTSTAIGLLVSLGAQYVVFPWFGIYATLGDHLGITACFTVVSVARGYVVRRLFNK